MDPQAFIFFGRSGSGKGTQAKLLVEALKEKTGREVLYVETGQRFREFKTGETLSSELTKEVIELLKQNEEKNFIFIFDHLEEITSSTADTLSFLSTLAVVFGAGHPFMFALAVALGCDSFDSAAYSIFARQDRYMTNYGTRKLDQLEYFPCSCPICNKNTPSKIREMPKAERQEQLARHNLHISFREIKHIKQSIIEGINLHFI